MTPDRRSFLIRLYGDVADMKTRFDLIVQTLNKNDPSDDAEIYYHLRKVIDTCDEISSNTEKEFRNEIPAEVPIPGGEE